MKNKIRQILYDMRHQPLVAWVTVIGTALSIFLIMIVVMIQQSGVVPYAPESNRDRMLYGAYFHAESTDPDNGGSASAGLSYRGARRLYGDLDGVEKISFFALYGEDADVKGTSGTTFNASLRRADAAFWDIFDHKLLKGRFYTKAEVDADRPVAVVTESTAARLFGNDEPLGNTVLVNHEPYEVVGVVADHTKLATSGSGDVFLPMSPAIVDGERTRYDFNANWDINMFGSVYVALLVKQGVDFSHVRDQVKARYAEIDTEIAEKGCRSVYHGAPYDQATLASGLRGSNSTPDTESGRNLRLLVYLILLIVPAINLSSMLHSRMRSRVSEIGVRRAYGCTRSRLIADIITENFLVTLAGSIIGLAMGVTVALTYDGLFTDSSFRTVHPSLGIILNWGVVATAVGFCFLLNLISASVPAWQASRVNPVQAINSSNK